MDRKLASTCLALCLVSCSSTGTTSSGFDAGAGGRGVGGDAAGGRGVGGGGAGGAKGSGGVVDAGGDARPTAGSPCESNADCDPTNNFILRCLAPGESRGCGSCQFGTDKCTSDAECALDAGAAVGPQICQPESLETSCFCNNPRSCVSGCRTSDVCGAGQACNPIGNRCEHACVAGDGTCPVDLVCNGSGFCSRKSCRIDSECSAACVKGYCYSARGRCDYTAV